jgi:hypothetical protein
MSAWLMCTPIFQSNTSSSLKPKLHVQQWSVKVDFTVSADEFKSKVPNPAFTVSVLHEYIAVAVVTQVCSIMYVVSI